MIDSDDLVALDGYTFLRNDREEKEVGGIGVYVKSNYPVTIIAKSDPVYRNAAEYLIVEIKINSQNLLFSVVYCRPGAKKKQNEFFNHIAQLLPSYSHIIITGNFNLNMAVKNTDYRYLKNKLDSFALFLVPSQPTHHTSRETVVNGMSTIHESHT